MTCLDSSCRQRREVELVGGATFEAEFGWDFWHRATSMRKHWSWWWSISGTETKAAPQDWVELWFLLCCPKRRKHRTKVVPGKRGTFLGLLLWRDFLVTSPKKVPVCKDIVVSWWWLWKGELRAFSACEEAAAPHRHEASVKFGTWDVWGDVVGNGPHHPSVLSGKLQRTEKLERSATPKVDVVRKLRWRGEKQAN